MAAAVGLDSLQLQAEKSTETSKCSLYLLRLYVQHVLKIAGLYFLLFENSMVSCVPCVQAETYCIYRVIL